MKTYCLKCHQTKTALAGFNLDRFPTLDSMHQQRRTWTKVLARLRDGEMPPQGNPVPSAEQREKLVAWLDNTLRVAACADGIAPTAAPIRRLNKAEYAATVRDLLNIHINAGRALPAEGAGGEGFDNAAETLFLSPVHAEKYLEAAKLALDYAMKDPRSTAVFLTAKPDKDHTPEQAGRKVLEAFLPRAFRRPATPVEIEKYYALFAASLKKGASYETSIQYALQGVLLSPNFLFRMEEPNPEAEPRPLDQYALASRLSYFLWGSMPDKALFDLAAQGKLHDPAVLKEQIARMLKDTKARESAESFVDQWLNTRELGRDIKPDATLFPTYYDAEIQSAIRYEPSLFFLELLTENLSLVNLIDSKWTILTNKLAKHYGYNIQGLRQQPKRVELPENHNRGGLLGMAAVLAVSSLPARTSPVLRGKWVLDAMMGTPAPPPPPNVPPLDTAHNPDAPKTLKERLMLHRAHPVCAGCHNRIDPPGFALENYDVLGRWRTEDSGKPIDAKGQLPDGASFDGPTELKQLLMRRKDQVFRNMTVKYLGYALGRGLTMEEHCTVDNIVAQLGKEDYAAQTLVREIVTSVPFRYQAGTAPNRPVAANHHRMGAAPKP